MSAEFKDHFSDASEDYLRYRPTYPDALFDHLAGIAPALGVAWDCGCGSGQAAVALAARFDRVIATDASAKQIAQALAHERVTYAVATAEASGLDDRGCDLVTVAQALHWFDLEGFAAEVRRVLQPGGVVAAWTYKRLRIAPSLDPVLDELYGPSLGSYWPPERGHVDDGYARLNLPFPELPRPLLAMTSRWTLDRLIRYLHTWSAAKRCLVATGRDLVAECAPALTAAWGDPAQERTVTWPLVVRVWRPEID